MVEDKIRKMYIKDRIVILLFLVLFILVMAFFIIQVNAITTDRFVSIIIILSGLTVATFGTASDLP